MTKYNIIYSTGVTHNYTGTVLGCMRYATKYLSHGSNVTIFTAEGRPFACKTFWRALNKFGWTKWTIIES